MRVERIQTADGSWTLRDVDRDLTFRSVHGAVTESDYVFVDGSGIDERAATAATWRVLEVGFGAALNFHRTRLRATTLGVRLHYVALERDPVSPDVIDHDEETNAVVRSALARGGEVHRHGVHEIIVHHCDWRDAPALRGSFDAVYHDPFGPRVDPHVWSEACFRWSRSLAAPGARLVTYAVAGDVRRALEAAGWEVHKREGPPGKREVLFAVAR